jgi:hypothetical protein
MNSKPLALLYVVLLLLCAREAAAQPTCIINYDLSYPCHDLNAGLIFVGRVVALTAISQDAKGNISQTEVSALGQPMWGKAVVLVETLYKGEAAGKVELAFHSYCWGTIAKDKEYVFNVGRTKEGLQADRWSVALDSVRQDDLTYFTEMMRAVIKGGRQPRLYGRLLHFNRKYDTPHTGPPIPGVTVVAESGAKYETRTDADGRYEFRDLPDGEYRVYPLLPESLRLPDDLHYKVDRNTGLVELERTKKTGERGQVYNQSPCGTQVNLVVWDNGVIAGRAEGADGRPLMFLPRRPASSPRRQEHLKDAQGKSVESFEVLLWRTDQIGRSLLPYPAVQVEELKQGEFAFINLSPGPYSLEFVGWGPGYKHVYLSYPIKLEPGQNVRDLVIRLPLTNK